LRNSLAHYKILNLKKSYEIIKIIQEECSISYIHFYGKFEKTAVEKEVSLYSLEYKTFPAGLFWKVVDVFEDLDISSDLIDERTKPFLNPFQCTYPFVLDINQITAIHMTPDVCRGYFKFPTGAGKTALMAGIIGQLGVRTLILEPSIELVSQNAEEIFQFTGQSVKLIRGRDSISIKEEFDPLIYIASIDTLTANFDYLVSINWFDQFQCIMGDEIHHATYTKEKIKKGLVNGKRKIIGRIPGGFTGYYNVFMACQNAYYRYGFTATDEEVKRSISALTGDLLYSVTEDSLIKSGRVSKPVILIYYLEIPFYDNERDAFRFGIYENQKRNEILIAAMKFIVENGGSVLFMLDSKKYQLNQIKDWTNFPIVTGDTKLKAREIIYNKIREGKEQGLIMTVAKEGLNLPSVDAIIRASGKKSIRLVIQEKGRGSRITSEKNSYLVIDFYDDDKYKRIYNPISGRYRTKKGYLSKHSDERIAIYEQTKLGEMNFINSLEELQSFIEAYFKKNK